MGGVSYIDRFSSSDARAINIYLRGIMGSDGPADCIDCEAGKYNPMWGSDDSSDCIDCEAGKYSPMPGSDDPADCMPDES